MSVIALRRLLSVAALSLFIAAPAAHAQYTFFPDDTTLDATNPVSGTALVGYANFDNYLNSANATSPTIAIVEGGSVGGDLQIFNSSTINISGGEVGGNFGKLLAYDNSTVNLSGGSVDIDLNTQNSSVLNFSGGIIGDDLVTYDTSTANMSGGTVGHALLTNGNSTFNLSGGTIVDRVFIQDSSVLNIFGTSLSSVLTDPNFENFYSEYTLSGRLSDSTDVTGRVIFIQNGSGASFTLNNVTSISGLLTFEGIAASSAPQNVLFTFRPTDGSADITQTVSVPPSGVFRVSGLPAKSYTAHIKAEKYLAVNISVDMSNGDVSGVTTTLSSGDATNDNRVDIADFGLLINSYGGLQSDPASGYDNRADFNDDGLVDIADFGLLINNYGAAGDL